jgi:hypothetical protein
LTCRDAKIGNRVGGEHATHLAWRIPKRLPKDSSEVAVMTEAQLEGELAQIGRARAQLHEGSDKPQLDQVLVRRASDLGPEDMCQVEG